MGTGRVCARPRFCHETDHWPGCRICRHRDFAAESEQWWHGPPPCAGLEARGDHAQGDRELIACGVAYALCKGLAIGRVEREVTASLEADQQVLVDIRSEGQGSARECGVLDAGRMPVGI